MGKPKNVITTVIPEVTTSIKLDQNDLVSVAVAEVEINLRNERKRLEDNISTLKTTYAKLDKSVKKNKDALANKNVKIETTALAAALKTFTGTSIGDSSVEIRSSNEKEMTVVYSVEYETSRYNSHVVDSKKVVLKFTKSILSDLKDKEATNEKIQEATKDLQKIGIELRDLASTERQARAAVVKQALSGSAEGRALLASVSKDMLPRLN